VCVLNSTAMKPNCSLVALGGLVVNVLAIGPKVRGLKPGRGRCDFKGDKNPQHDFLRRVSKAVGPMSSYFKAC
jgi:hypothetical protein